jgi:hypothetical protein
VNTHLFKKLRPNPSPLLVVFWAGLFIAAACTEGGGAPTNGAALPGGAMSAMIDGVAWSASHTQVIGQSTMITVVGSTNLGQPTQTIVNIQIPRGGPGTLMFVAGTLPSSPGAWIVIGNDPQKVWSSYSIDGSGSGGSGSVTLTILTPTHAVGTFSFVGQGIFVTPGQRALTNGQFDVTF